MSVIEAPVAVAPIALSFEQIKELFETLIAGRALNGPSPEMELALESIKASAAANAMLGEEFKRTTRRSNADHRHESVFTFKAGCQYCADRTAHPEGGFGHPKPKLIYDVTQCGFPVKADACTVVEVELLNAFEKDMEARKGKWTAKIDRRTTVPRLQINFPAQTNDDFADAPIFTHCLMELLHGDQVVDPIASHARIAALEAQVRDLINAAGRPSDGRRRKTKAA